MDCVAEDVPDLMRWVAADPLLTAAEAQWWELYARPAPCERGRDQEKTDPAQCEPRRVEKGDRDQMGA